MNCCEFLWIEKFNKKYCFVNWSIYISSVLYIYIAFTLCITSGWAAGYWWMAAHILCPKHIHPKIVKTPHDSHHMHAHLLMRMVVEARSWQRANWSRSSASNVVTCTYGCTCYPSMRASYSLVHSGDARILMRRARTNKHVCVWIHAAVPSPKRTHDRCIIPILMNCMSRQLRHSVLGQRVALLLVMIVASKKFPKFTKKPEFLCSLGSVIMTSSSATCNSLIRQWMHELRCRTIHESESCMDRALHLDLIRKRLGSQQRLPS